MRQALQEASRRSEGSNHSNGVSSSVRGGLNFKQFCRMLSSGSLDSLDLYDDRCERAQRAQRVWRGVAGQPVRGSWALFLTTGLAP